MPKPDRDYDTIEADERDERLADLKGQAEEARSRRPADDAEPEEDADITSQDDQDMLNSWLAAWENEHLTWTAIAETEQDGVCIDLSGSDVDRETVDDNLATLERRIDKVKAKLG